SRLKAHWSVYDPRLLQGSSKYGRGCDYLCRSPNRAKRMECVQLAAAFDCGRTFEWALTRRKRQQAARTPYASRGSVTDRNNRALWTMCKSEQRTGEHLN